jgi:beta-glucoside operon transcriptional antiterminator
MEIKKVISNNAVLARRGQDEVVVLGAGVGFGVRPRDHVDASRVEKVFLSEDAADDRLTLMLADIPLPFLRVATQIAELAHERLHTPISQSIIIPIADHLTFAAKRAEASEPFIYPLRWEVSQIYPAEYELGQVAVGLARDALGVDIHPDEAVALAMHLVNAQFATPGQDHALAMTETITRILDMIEQTFNLELDRHSMDCARFITHLRYVFARIATKKQIVDRHPTLFEAITNSQPDAMQCAAKVRYLIERAFGEPVTTDETAYLGLHIARLLAGSQER